MIRTKKLALRNIAIGLCLLIIGGTSASASTIISPVGASAYSPSEGVSVNGLSAYYISGMYRQWGLSEHFESGVDDFDDFIALDTTHTNRSYHNHSWGNWARKDGNWIFPTDPVITLNLGAQYLVDRFTWWAPRGISGMTLSASSDGTNYSEIGTLADYNNALRFLSFDPLIASHVRLELTCGSFCEIGEVAFSANSVPSPVPLPAGGLLLLSGLGGIAALRRRKRRATMLFGPL